jgi:hypothetical protein
MPTFSSISAGRKHWKPHDGRPDWDSGVGERTHDENALARMNDDQRRDRVLGEFTASTLDPVGSLGGDKGMAVLKDMNDLEAGHDEFVRSLAPRVDVV